MIKMIQKKTSMLAVLSLVFGCLFIIPVFGVIFSISALILGVIALVVISKNEDKLKGRALAIVGTVLGISAVVYIGLASITFSTAARGKILNPLPDTSWATNDA